VEVDEPNEDRGGAINEGKTQVTEDGSHLVIERHRHRYEVNPAIVEEISSAGLQFTGRDDKGERMEICELGLQEHPFYFGCQFHPEFKSRPNRPSPPFFAFVGAALEENDRKDSGDDMKNSGGKSGGKGSGGGRSDGKSSDGKSAGKSDERKGGGRTPKRQLSKAGKIFQQHEQLTSPHKRVRKSLSETSLGAGSSSMKKLE